MMMSSAYRMPVGVPETWAWQLVGACRKEDSELFFHPEGERGSRAVNRENAAKAICVRCPVLVECAAHALAVREPYGVWGGMTEHDRDEIVSGQRPSPAGPPTILAQKSAPGSPTLARTNVG